MPLKSPPDHGLRGIPPIAPRFPLGYSGSLEPFFLAGFHRRQLQFSGDHPQHSDQLEGAQLVISLQMLIDGRAEGLIQILCSHGGKAWQAMLPIPNGTA